MPGFNPYRHSSGLWWAFVALPGIGALAWRRRWPRPVCVTVTAAAGWLLAARWGDDWGALSPLVVLPAPLLALYTVAAQTPRRTSRCALVMCMVVIEAGLLWDTFRPEGALVTAAALVVAWALGENSRSRRSYLAALHERSVALEAERVERDRRAAAEERARVARELHDVVAHHVSVLTLQAGVARVLAEAGQPVDREALGRIEATGRQAMTELRHALGVIRQPADGAASQPGLARLPDLLDRMQGAGLTVSVEGPRGRLSDGLPEGVDLAAYRIVQEALTNALRHSSAGTARVMVRRVPGRLELAVTDDGPARLSDGPAGFGLIGLRERAAGCGGWLRAGPRPGGGFEVRAHLPVARLSPTGSRPPATGLPAVDPPAAVPGPPPERLR
jgi:signal transduction histidine kinase